MDFKELRSIQALAWEIWIENNYQSFNETACDRQEVFNLLKIPYSSWEYRIVLPRQLYPVTSFLLTSFNES